MCQQFKTNFHTGAKYKYIHRVIIIFLPHATIWNQFPPRVNDKSEGVGFKVEKQNKAMEKILKK